MPTDNMVGYVEDVDEDIGSTIGVESTRRYARSAAARSPERERSNTGKPRMPESDSDDETASSSSSLSDSDSTPAPTRGTRPVPVEHRRPLHKDRDHHRRPPQDSRPPRDNRALARDDRQRRERRPREDDDDHRRPPRPQPKDRDPRDARDPRDLRDPRGPKKTRPGPPKHAASQPVVSQGAYRRGQFEDPAAYGVQQQQQQLQQPAASGRPRAKSRPASYYAGQPPRPPLDMGWPGPHAPLPPPPGAFGMGNFPPPHMFPGGPPMHPGMPPPQSPMGMGPPPFFDGPSPMGPPPPGEHLRHRFDGGGRPASAMGFGSPPEAIGYFNEKYDDYEEEQHQKVARRSSRAKKAPPPLEERKKLPPSEFALKRTQSARPTSAAYKPPPSAREPMREPMREMREPLREPLREAPREHTRERDHQLRERPLSRQGHQRPPPSHRRSVGFVDQQAFDEDDFLGGEVDLYQEVSPNQRRTALARPRRSSSVAYDQHGYDIVPAGNRGRRSSMYGPLPGESGGVSLEEDGRYFDALRYQEDVSGGAPMPLTAETLRKASKRGELASSRSTRSSGSHDESDYKRSSHTTGLTTQSSAAHNNDDFTIKVSGQAVVKLPGAQIECDGGEITFSGNRGAGAGPGSGMHGASRAGSDKESTVYQLDDARSSRMDRKALPHRPRATSQSDVHSRIYAPIHAPYEHAPYEHVPYEHAPYEQAPYEHGPYDAFEPYEPVTYEHAPYDPSLAASNFY